MLAGILIFVLIVVALLAVPLTMTYRLSWKQAFSGDLELRWAFGLVRVDTQSKKSESAQAAADENTPAPRTGSGRKRGRTRVAAAIRSKPFRRRVIRFASDLWRAVHKQDLRLNLRLGLGDPADTGQLWAIVGPLTALFASDRNVTVAIEPAFLEETLELDSSGTVRLIPLQLAGLTLALLFSPAFVRGVLAMRAG